MIARDLGKFIDPCGWDAQWVVTDEVVGFTTVEGPVASHQDALYAKFREPRSWALEWDGLAIFEADARSLVYRA